MPTVCLFGIKGRGYMCGQTSCRMLPTSTTICIFERIDENEILMDTTNYSWQYHLVNKTRIMPQLIRQAESNKDEEGFYEAELLPGNYTIFVSVSGNESCSEITSFATVSQVSIGKELKNYDIIINTAAE